MNDDDPERSGYWPAVTPPPPSHGPTRFLALLALALLGTLLLASLTACAGPVPPIPAPRPVPPAQVEADDLRKREETARLEATRARSAAQVAQNDAERAKEQARAHLAEAEARTLASLRQEAEARAKSQAIDMDRATQEAQDQARRDAARRQADQDQRLARFGLAGAGGISVVAAAVLAWMGMTRLALLLPLAVIAAGSVGLGLLEAGPWIGSTLSWVINLGLLLGVVLLWRALHVAVRFGEEARQVNPSDQVAIKDLEDTARTRSKPVAGIIARALRSVRALKG